MKRHSLSRLAVFGAVLLAGQFGVRSATIRTFQEGVNGYAGTQDTFIDSTVPASDHSGSTVLELDQEDVGGQFGLVKFDNVFGSGPTQVPAKAKILFASLTITINNEGGNPTMHRMLVPWEEASTWDSLVNGVAPDDAEAAVTEDALIQGGKTGTVTVPLLVSTLQAWSDGTQPNHGWLFFTTSTDGTDFYSSEASDLASRPMLTIVSGTVDEPFVRSVSPANGATAVPVESNIDLIIVDGATQLNPASVRLTVNGQSVTPTVTRSEDPANETVISYNPAADFPPNTTIPFRLVYADNASPAHVSTNDFSFTTRATTISLVLIDDKQLWKYDQSATDLGTAWRERNFNDSAWPEGTALLAHEGTTVEPVRTELLLSTDAGDYIWTSYFRTHFNYTGPLGGNLILRHVIDDGAVFYLNGVEIHRFGFADGAPVTFTSPSDGHENAWEGPFVIPGSALVAGDNVFAAEVHQSGTGSSDVVFGAELLATVSDIKPAKIDLVSPAADATDVVTSAVIEIRLADGSTQVQTSSIQLSFDGQAVSPTVSKPAGSGITTISYDPPGELPVNSKHTFKLVVSDNATPPNVVTHESSFTTKGNTLVNIDGATKWRYNRSGTDLGTAWREKNFNDSTWPEGAALIADETGATAEPVRTPISRFDDAGNVMTTMYFRTHFNFTGDPKTVQLKLRHVIDDGAVFYLNGVEIHRFGLADGAAYDYSTFFTGHEGNAYSGPYDISTASLVAGDNVVAVEVHQADATSSDITFGAEIQVVTPEPSAEVKITKIARNADGSITLEWTGGGTLQSAPAVTGPWQDVAGAASPHTLTPSTAALFGRIKK